jgi:hypothetical protein
MTELTKYHIYNDDKLIKLIKENFNNDDNQLFTLSFKLFNETQNNSEDFIIDLNEIYNWLGFARKDHAKRLLVNKFKENIDYKINKVFPHTGENLCGRPIENILLTIICFKKFCLKSDTNQSDKIYDYYIKMEDIITKYIENKHNEILYEINQNLEFKNQEFENNKMLLEDTLTKLHLKNQESNSNNFQIRNFNPSSKLIINTFNTEYEVVKQAAKNVGFKVRQIEPMFYNPAPSNFNYSNFDQIINNINQNSAS